MIDDIIDAHINLASVKVLPEQFVRDTASNMFTRASLLGERVSKRMLTHMLLKQYQDHDADGLVKEMDDAGIAHAVLLAPDFSRVAKCELSAEEVLQHHHQVALRHPGRFFLFAGVDPRGGKEAQLLFEKAVTDYGCVGLKLYPPAGYSPSDPSVFPLYEICAAKQLPVCCHTGPGWHSLDFSLGHPSQLDRATREFPQVNFIMGHGGVSYLEDSCHLCMYRENVYMDISGFPAVTNPNGWQAHLNQLFRLGVNHKIVFGTSWPASRMSVSLREMLGDFRADRAVFKDVSARDRALILRGNIARLLRLL